MWVTKAPENIVYHKALNCPVFIFNSINDFKRKVFKYYKLHLQIMHVHPSQAGENIDIMMMESSAIFVSSSSGMKLTS